MSQNCAVAESELTRMAITREYEVDTRFTQLESELHGLKLSSIADSPSDAPCRFACNGAPSATQHVQYKVIAEGTGEEAREALVRQGNFVERNEKVGHGALVKGGCTKMLERLACAIVPLKPNELTPKTRPRSVGVPSCVGSTKSIESTPIATNGLSLLRCAFPQATRPSARINPSCPDEASLCPTFAFAAPIASDDVRGSEARTEARAAASVGSPSAVPVP